MTSADNIVPGSSSGWQDYWEVGNEHEPDGYWLTYAEDVPANHILTMQFYCTAKTKDACDVVIDWGDGNVTQVSKSSGIIYQNFESSDKIHLYSGFTASHSYSEESKFIVKIYGKTYFMVRCNPYGTADDCIVSRIFDRDLPVASCLRNISSIALNSKKLLKIDVPYGYDFKGITNWS